MLTPERKCEVDNCNAKHYGRGYCSKHFRRFKRHGNPLIVLPKSIKPTNKIEVSMQQHFESKFVREDINKCWEWLGAKDKDGYGDFNFIKGYQSYAKLKAHRVSYEFYKGKISKGLMACHTCDNRGCVNPHHIFIGTAQDNATDMVKKKRSMSGERNNKAKLTIQDVKHIKSYLYQGVKRMVLSEIYKVHPDTISRIKTGVQWGDVC